jgi:hypothetical protein
VFGPVIERSTIALDPNRTLSLSCATASEDHECKVDGASRQSGSIWCPDGTQPRTSHNPPPPIPP